MMDLHERAERSRKAAKVIDNPVKAYNDIEKLIAALEWYERQVKDCRKFGKQGEEARSNLDQDGGKRARAVFEEVGLE